MDRFSHNIGAWVEQTVASTIAALSYIPGSRIIGRYIVSSHQNDPARTVFELLLFLFAVRYFLAAKQPYNKSSLKLSETEIDDLVAEWEPESLVTPGAAEETQMLDEIPVIEGPNGVEVRIRGRARPLLNLTSTDLYHWGAHADLQQVGIDSVRTYGVGSCGPAGFYGNEDAHIDAEKAIAAYLGTEGSILYAQGLATASSVIPCFSKRGDVIVADSLVNMSLQKGIQLSRARVFYYKHNDMADLEANLKRANASYRGKGPLPRRFIVTEGLFEYTGQSPDLRKIVELKTKYKYRLMLDESWSIGTLGATGRGLAEAAGVPRSDVDVTVGSLANAPGSSGGYCAGESYMVEHQRIVSLAYTFSATCPPYLARNTVATLGKMGTPEFASQQLRPLVASATALYDVLVASPAIEIISTRGVPIIIFQLAGAKESDAQEAVLGRIVHGARDQDILISRLRRVADFELYPYVHAIRLYVPAGLDATRASAVGHTLVQVIEAATR